MKNERSNKWLVIFCKPIYNGSNIFLSIGGNMKAWKRRTGIKICNIGFKYRIAWIMRVGEKLRKSGMKEYI